MQENGSSGDDREANVLNRVVVHFLLEYFNDTGLNLRRNYEEEASIILRDRLELKLISTLSTGEWKKWLPPDATFENGAIEGRNFFFKAISNGRYFPLYPTCNGKIFYSSNFGYSNALLTELYCMLNQTKLPQIALQELARQFGISSDDLFHNYFPAFPLAAVGGSPPFLISVKYGKQVVVPVIQTEIPSLHYKRTFCLYGNKSATFMHADQIKNSSEEAIAVITDSPLLSMRNPTHCGRSPKLYISSFYGEDRGAKDIDWTPLKNKNIHVYYLLIQHSQRAAQELFRTAFTVCEAFKQHEITDVTIISYFEGVNSTYFPEVRNEPQFIKYKDFKPIVENIINHPIITGSIFDSRPLPPSIFLLAPAIKERTVSLFYGDPQSGKTLFVLSLALAVSQGIPAFENWRAPLPAKVLYIHGEDPGNELEEKFGLLTRVYVPFHANICRLPVPNTPKLSVDVVCRNVYAKLQLLRSQGHMTSLLVLDNLSCFDQLYSVNSELVLLQDWLNKFQSEGLAVWLIPPRKILTSKRLIAATRLGLNNIFKVSKSDCSLLNTLSIGIIIEQCASLSRDFIRNFKLRIDFNAAKPYWHLFSGSSEEQIRQAIVRLTKEKYTEKQIAESLSITVALVKKKKRELRLTKRRIPKPPPFTMFPKH